MQNDSVRVQGAIDELERHIEASLPKAHLDLFLFLTMLASVGIIFYGALLYESIGPVALAVVGAGTSNLLLASSIYDAREAAGKALVAIVALGRLLTTTSRVGR